MEPHNLTLSGVEGPKNRLAGGRLDRVTLNGVEGQRAL